MKTVIYNRISLIRTIKEAKGKGNAIYVYQM